MNQNPSLIIIDDGRGEQVINTNMVTNIIRDDLRSGEFVIYVTFSSTQTKLIFTTKDTRDAYFDKMLKTLEERGMILRV